MSLTYSLYSSLSSSGLPEERSGDSGGCAATCAQPGGRHIAGRQVSPSVRAGGKALAEVGVGRAQALRDPTLVAAARPLTPGGVRWHRPSMAEFKVRNLDDLVARPERTACRAHGLSVAEEIRRLLSDSVLKKRQAFARRAAASRAATRRTRKGHATDSTVLIRPRTRCVALSGRGRPSSMPRSPSSGSSTSPGAGRRPRSSLLRFSGSRP